MLQRGPDADQGLYQTNYAMIATPIERKTLVHTTKYSMAATHLLSYLVRVMGYIRLNLMPVK